LSVVERKSAIITDKQAENSEAVEANLARIETKYPIY
jgi:hypothetical protein